MRVSANARDRCLFQSLVVAARAVACSRISAFIATAGRPKARAHLAEVMPVVSPRSLRVREHAGQVQRPRKRWLRHVPIHVNAHRLESRSRVAGLVESQKGIRTNDGGGQCIQISIRFFVQHGRHVLGDRHEHCSIQSTRIHRLDCDLTGSTYCQSTLLHCSF